MNVCVSNRKAIEPSHRRSNQVPEKYAWHGSAHTIRLPNNNIFDLSRSSKSQTDATFVEIKMLCIKCLYVPPNSTQYTEMIFMVGYSQPTSYKWHSVH